MVARTGPSTCEGDVVAVVAVWLPKALDVELFFRNYLRFILLRHSSSSVVINSLEIGRTTAPPGVGL